MKKIKIIVLGLCMLVFNAFITGCFTSTANFQAGIRDFREQNYRDAFERLMPIARSGNPDAAYAIGYMYYYGLGVTEDQPQAMQWLHRAASKRQPDAIRALQLLSDVPSEPNALKPTSLQKYETL